MVLSSAALIPGTDRATGTWFEELAAPYYVFKDAGLRVTLASPKGGPAPLDPLSELPEAQTPATDRFRADAGAMAELARTAELPRLDLRDFSALFFSGGLGPVYDLSNDAVSIALIETAARVGKPIAAVCHGPAVLRRTRGPDGYPLVRGRRVTGFSNSEEQAVNGLDLTPFLIEDELRRLGGVFSKADDWTSHIAVDGLLITGQNPASSAAAANAVLDALKRAATVVSQSTSPPL